MKLFSKANLINALKSLGVMMIILLLCLFIGSASLSDDGFIGWGLFAGFLLIYWATAYMDGIIRGEGEAKLADRLAHQAEKTGKPLDEAEVAACYHKKKGLGVAILIAVPGVVLSILSLIFVDGNMIVRIITRLYFTPYMKLFIETIPPLLQVAMYFAFSLLYPLFYFLGYLQGPRSYAKVKETIRKNEEDYKNGVRRKRPKKRRRSFFW